MRRVFRLILTIALLLSITNAGGLAEAKAKSKKIKRQMTRAGYTFMGTKGKRLKNSTDKTFQLFLYKGNSYALLGYGDNSVKDLDVQVYNSRWEIVKEDYSSSGPMYALRFKVKETGVYYVTTYMYKGSGYFFQSVGWK